MSFFRTLSLSDPRFETENLRTIIVKSPALEMRGEITVYYPQSIPPEEPLPLVLLLHGVYGSHLSWCMKGGAHRTAARLIIENRMRPMMIAMPSDGLWGDGSGYLPHHGKDFERWIVEEVPQAVKEAFPDFPTCTPVFIAGLSMGGFGALRLGGAYPEKFAGISGHSSITRAEEMISFVEENWEDDLLRYEVFETFRQAGTALPPVRFDCGTEDELLAANRLLHQQLTASGIPHTYEEFSGGHEWSYWETHLEDTLLFFESILTQKNT